jgi:acyl-CoA oxidase
VREKGLWRIHNSDFSLRLLPFRGASNPLPHSLTYFRDVSLPGDALLGDAHRAPNQKAAFFELISRVIVGTLSMGTFAVLALRQCSVIAARYSQRRRVAHPISGAPTPIVAFITQATPVLMAVAQGAVLDAFADAAQAQFVASPHGTERHLLAAIFKVTTTRMGAATIQTLIDRCGAQGLFEVNQMTTVLVRHEGMTVGDSDADGHDAGRPAGCNDRGRGCPDDSNT